MASPEPGADVAERPVGGLGVLLASAMARQVECRRTGAGNRISLVIDAGRSVPS